MSRMAKHPRSLFWLCVLVAGILSGAGVATALEIGEMAPDFALPSTTGENISLRQYLGKKAVLIEFFIMDFTPV